MKNQTIPSSQQIDLQSIAALLKQTPAPIISHISIPVGTNTSSISEQKEITTSFTGSINKFNLRPSENQQTQELSFGAPQIDLALPKGTLARSAMHEFNPKHYRDQIATLKCAITIAAREQASNQQTSGQQAPIFCFLSEQQEELFAWLTSDELSELNINKEDLIIITAKHTDDLLWAIEETMATAPRTTIVAHFNLLENITAQRLAFLAKANQSTCILVCNHKIDGPKHSLSQWSIAQLNAGEIEETTMHLKLSHSAQATEPNAKPMSWTIKWKQNHNRFTASINNASPIPAPTLH